MYAQVAPPHSGGEGVASLAFLRHASSPALFERLEPRLHEEI